jgi:hypothetical protein
MKIILFFILSQIFCGETRVGIKFNEVPTFMEKSENFSLHGRLSKIFAPRDQTLFMTLQSFWVIESNQILYGPIKNIKTTETDEICSFSLSLIFENNLTEWRSGTFCEKYFCQSKEKIPWIQSIQLPKTDVNHLRNFQFMNSVFAVCFRKEF